MTPTQANPAAEQTYRGNPSARLTSGDPLATEEALVRHPRFKVVLMHMDFPYIDATVALMNGYPSVYVNVAPFNRAIAAPDFRPRTTDRQWLGASHLLRHRRDDLGRCNQQRAAGSGGGPYLMREQCRLMLRDNASRRKPNVGFEWPSMDQSTQGS